MILTINFFIKSDFTLQIISSIFINRSSTIIFNSESKSYNLFTTKFSFVFPYIWFSFLNGPKYCKKSSSAVNILISNCFVIITNIDPLKPKYTFDSIL